MFWLTGPRVGRHDRRGSDADFIKEGSPIPSMEFTRSSYQDDRGHHADHSDNRVSPPHPAYRDGRPAEHSHNYRLTFNCLISKLNANFHTYIKY